MAEREFTGGGRLVGYCRVSTAEQDLALQLAAMRAAGVAVAFEEKRSGATLERPALEEALASIGPGDTLVVFKVDRLARSLLDLMGVLERLNKAGAAFRSLTEPIETASAAGRLMVQILGAFAEFERAVIRERCEAGRREAKAKGVRFGRPRSWDYADAIRLRSEGLTWSAIARELGQPLSTVRRAVAHVRAGTRSLEAPGLGGAGAPGGPAEGRAAPGGMGGRLPPMSPAACLVPVSEAGHA